MKRGEFIKGIGGLVGISMLPSIVLPQDKSENIENKEEKYGTGLILTSPNGTRFLLTVNNNGCLITTPI